MNTDTILMGDANDVSTSPHAQLCCRPVVLIS